MPTFTSLLLTIWAGLLAVPSIVLLCEAGAAILLARREVQRKPAGARGTVGVLIPAHNESSGLLPTLADIKRDLRPGDRAVVVADNCNDDTAAVAAAAGAEAVVRNDPARIGKGYALDWGLRHFAADPPDVLIVVDADCRLEPGALDRLAEACAGSRRPAQALYLMRAPEGAAINHQVAEFAWRVKNDLRPAGLKAMGLPCQLTGTGMAFPWTVIQSAELASGHIVEDLKLGLDLALAGSPPVFCPSAIVTSEFPVSSEGTDNQRRRWEHGHLRIIRTMVPRLLWAGLRRRDIGLVALALDIAVPPLVILALLLLVTNVLAAAAAILGMSPSALSVGMAGLAAFAIAIMLAWNACGRDVLPARAFLAIGPYVLHKFRIHNRFSAKGTVKAWVRTDRSDSATLPKAREHEPPRD